MTSQLPKLRDDLEIRRHTSDGTIAVVKDPISGELFRVKTVELSIMRQLDGATPLDVIQSRLEQRVGGSIRSEALVEFVKALDRNGLLQSERGTNIRHPRRVSGSLLYFRVRLFDPDRLLRALVPRHLHFLHRLQLLHRRPVHHRGSHVGLRQRHLEFRRRWRLGLEDRL